MDSHRCPHAVAASDRLEEPGEAEAVAVSIEQPPEEIVNEILAKLGIEAP